MQDVAGSINLFVVFTNSESKWNAFFSSFKYYFLFWSNDWFKSLLICFFCIVSRGEKHYSGALPNHNAGAKLLYCLNLVSVSLLVKRCLIKQELCMWTSLGSIWKFKQQVYNTVQRSQSPLVLNFQRFLRWMKWGGLVALSL